jgi:hypothetical protein
MGGAQPQREAELMKSTLKCGTFVAKMALFATILVPATLACGSIAESRFDERTTSSTPTPRPPTSPTTVPSIAVHPYLASDVAILFPLPKADEQDLLVRPRASAPNLGAPVLRRDTFARVLPSGSLDPVFPSGFDDIAVVAVRADTCYPLGSSGCRTEIRAVVQGLYLDPSTGLTSASDGALHITYSAVDAEVRALAKLLHDERVAQGTKDEPLGVHPILAAEGLKGPLAGRARALLAPVLVESRITKITVYEHDEDPGGHRWTFSVFTPINGVLTKTPIPTMSSTFQVVEGSDPHVALQTSFAKVNAAIALTMRDPVAKLVAEGRPAPGTAGALELTATFESALRIENPLLHNTRTTDCVNCHLAEGARRVGAATYGLDPKSSKWFGNDPPHVDERSSVTNLHAFGYLGREVSIMRRTAIEANETATRLSKP